MSSAHISQRQSRRRVSRLAHRLYLIAALLIAGTGGPFTATADDVLLDLPQEDGYRGIWYSVGEAPKPYRFKYSGGMATYPQQHAPIAVYAPAANKTFFVYGGVQGDQRRLLHMVSYFDHATHKVPKPRILLDKQTNDAHDNPTLSIDPQGYLWIFSNSHGTSRPSFIHRSVRPYSIDAFEPILTTNFSYGQPWHLGEDGFLFLHTRYAQGRGLFWMTSRDGRSWREPQSLAKIEQGHYQVSWSAGGRVATALNFHPQRGGLDARTNLYYLETRDAGKTWQNAAGRQIQLPLTAPKNEALVYDYQAEGLLVYLKDMQFDDQGNPVVMYLTSRGHQPGPANDPRTWRLALTSSDFLYQGL